MCPECGGNMVQAKWTVDSAFAECQKCGLTEPQHIVEGYGILEFMDRKI